MKIKTTLALIALSTFAVTAQQKTEPLFEPLVNKKTIHFGFQTSLGLGYSTSEGRSMSAYVINPKASYFIADRLSLGIGYMGIGSGMLPSRKNSLYHNAELELKYYFNNSSRFLFYSQAGFLYGQFAPGSTVSSFAVSNKPASALKLGAGVMWRLKANPCIAFNVELNSYFVSGPVGSNRLSYIPSLSVGVSLFLPHKKKKVVSEKQKLLGEF